MIWLFSPSAEFGIIKVLGLAKRADSALTPRGRTRMDTKVATLVNPVSLFLIRRRSESGDRSEMENGSRVTPAFVSQPVRSSQIAYCYTRGFINAGATQGELPEGQERVPWG